MNDGLWRANPGLFLRGAYGRLVDDAGISPAAAAQAIVMTARLAGLPDPERILSDAVAAYAKSARPPTPRNEGAP